MPPKKKIKAAQVIKPKVEEEVNEDEPEATEEPAEEPAVEEEVPEEELAAIEESLPEEEMLLEEPVEETFEDPLVEEELAEDPFAEELPVEEDGLLEEVLEDGVLPDELPDVSEHLKESVEGSFALKRMLERDDDHDPKRPKTAEDMLRIKLATRWGLQGDLTIMHTLQNMPQKDVETIAATNYAPDRFNMTRSVGEQLAKYANELRERQMPGGGPLDCILTFKHRWKLTPQQNVKLQGLSHKDLRYILNNYDSTVPLEDVIAEAADHVPEESCTETALPAKPGAQTLGRFTRLELIDPVADAAVFGDANLTFALKLVKHRKALGHVGRVIATTFEDLPTLRQRYKEIDESIGVLEDHYAEVYHGVDCTRIAMDKRFEAMESSLGAVYYNFPHSGAVGGFFDGHPLVNWRHENLMRLFFRALRTFVKPGGVVKVASNQTAVGVRYSYIVESAIENEFVHIETMPFLEWHLHRYGRSYGDRRDAYKRPDAKNNQSYNAQNANSDMVYCFAYAPTGDAVGKPNIRTPPSLKTLCGATDGPFKNLIGAAKDNLAKQLHKRFLTEISGTHVG